LNILNRLKRTLVTVLLLSLLAGSFSLSCPALGELNRTAEEQSIAQIPEGAELASVFSDFENYTEKSMAQWHVPGMAVAVVRGDEVIYLHCFGNKTQNGTDPITPNTIFQIGSTTKAFTVALVAMMADEGKLQWEDRVVDHLPEFQLYDPWVTREFMVKDLLIHDSGLPPFACDDITTLGYGREKEMLSLRYVEPIRSFRSGHDYNNAMLLWAGRLVESKTGQTWEKSLHDRIFVPLGMENSSSDMESFLKAKDAASLHRLKDNKVRNLEIINLPMDWPYMDWIYVLGPAGGINSNIIDMSKWLRLQMSNGSLHDKQLISEQNMGYMHTPQTVVYGDAKLYSSLGWLCEEYEPYPLVWHNGGSFGHHSMVAFMPDAKLGIVVLSNSAVGVPEILSYWFFDRYFGKPAKDYSNESMTEALRMEELADAFKPKRPDPPDPVLPLERYVGNYSSEVYGYINITAEEKENRLLATMGPRRLQNFLYPWNRDMFFAHIPEFMNKTGFAAFRLDPNGNPESIEMTLFIEGEYGRRAEFKRLN